MHRTLSEASFLETPGRTRTETCAAALKTTPRVPKRVAFAPKTLSLCIRRVFLFAFVSVELMVFIRELMGFVIRS